MKNSLITIITLAAQYSLPRGARIGRFSKMQSSFLLQPDDADENFSPNEYRFMQSKLHSQFDFLLWIENLLFPGQRKYGPAMGEKSRCPSWNLRDNRESLDQYFHNTSNWQTDLNHGILRYQGNFDGREGKQSFPFFFLPRRPILSEALIHKSFQCKNAQISAMIKLDTAYSAGFVLRVYADRDFWAVLLPKGETPTLYRYDGGQIYPQMRLPGPTIRPDKNYAIQINDAMGDIRIRCMDVDDHLQFDNTYKLQSWDDLERQDQWGAGFMAIGGTADFVNPTFGDMVWGPQGELNQIRQAAAKKNLPSKYNEAVAPWTSYSTLLHGCPPGSLCAGTPYFYQD